MAYNIPPVPYGSFSDSTTQTMAANVPQVVTYDTDEIKSGIIHSTTVSPGRIIIPSAGIYFISYSAIADCNAVGKYIEFWLKVNGSNVPRSNTRSQLPNASVERCITVTYIYKFIANDYFELWVESNDAGMTIKATAAGGTLSGVASPSIILTVNKVGA